MRGRLTREQALTPKGLRVSAIVIGLSFINRATTMTAIMYPIQARMFNPRREQSF